MKKQQLKREFKDCANLLSCISTKKMPKIVKKDYEEELQDLCLNVARLTIDVYRRYDRYNEPLWLKRLG